MGEVNLVPPAFCRLLRGSAARVVCVVAVGCVATELSRTVKYGACKSQKSKQSGLVSPLVSLWFRLPQSAGIPDTQAEGRGFTPGFALVSFRLSQKSKQRGLVSPLVSLWFRGPQSAGIPDIQAEGRGFTPGFALVSRGVSQKSKQRGLVSPLVSLWFRLPHSTMNRWWSSVESHLR